MTVTVAQTTNTNTMAFWLNRTNELANAMTTVVVSTNSNTAAGNAAITGAFTANVLIANTVRVSNSTANIVIRVPNTSVISSGNYYLNANGAWAEIVTPITEGTFETSGLTAQEIDNYETATFNAVEYFVHVKNNIANGFQASKILTVHTGVGGTNAFATEYAIVASNGVLGSFAATSNGTHVKLTMTPAFNNTSVTFSRVNF
jgi:hypothetical protein